MTSTDHDAAMSDGCAGEIQDSGTRKAWSTPQVIVSVMRNSENHNNGNNSDITTSGIPQGNS
ncbi:MAG: hypothetical protein V4610_00785 [Pseudomonadota bacterium]|jgi:hypothetical protein|uniref:Uncharacterized protein n=1 Tax=hydrothermal vent metagenome TaxID=652676 RepID=A0A160TI49_9ZZZZ